jgi:transcription antitermination factor NusA-like protein
VLWRQCVEKATALTQHDCGVTFASDRNASLALRLGALPARPYGARTDEAVVIGDLLTKQVPEIAGGELEIVAIARRPGELSKVAVRRRLRVQPRTPRPVPLVLGRAGERIRAIKRELPATERVDIVQWHAEPLQYIAASLGLSYLPSVVLYPVRHRADILLGEIDYPAARGKRALNMLLTSALTSWQVRVKQIARSRNWHSLEAAQSDSRSVHAEVPGSAPKGLRVQVYGLNGLLPFGQISGVKRNTPPEVVAAKVQRRLRQELEVTVLRLDPDQGTIIVSERVPAGRQLRLPLT